MYLMKEMLFAFAFGWASQGRGWYRKAGQVDGVSILLSCLLLAADLPKDVRLHLRTSEESWAGCCLEIRLQQRRQ